MGYAKGWFYYLIEYFLKILLNVYSFYFKVHQKMTFYQTNSYMLTEHTECFLKKKRFQNSVEKREILSHRKNIPWIQLLSNFISTVKLLRSQNFYQKSVRENFRNFHTVIAWQKFRQNDDIISSTYKEWKVFSQKNVDFSVKIVIVTLYVSQCGNFSKSLPCSNFSSKHFIENVAELP